MTTTSSQRSPQHRRSETKETNVLVVALDAPIPAAFSNANVFVLAPALNSWLRRWVSDEDAARSRAQERVAAWLDRFERSGVNARGRVGDTDPLQAIQDALLTSQPTRSSLRASPSDRSGSPTSS